MDMENLLEFYMDKYVLDKYLCHCMFIKNTDYF
jgi:hypothetical protein